MFRDKRQTNVYHSIIYYNKCYDRVIHRILREYRKPNLRNSPPAGKEKVLNWSRGGDVI